MTEVLGPRGLLIELKHMTIRKSFVLGLFSGIAQAASATSVILTTPCGTTREYELKTFPLDDVRCECGEDGCYLVKWETK